ncbi:MAG: peptidylprolyl isomerase [Bacilli bacterium]
MKKKLIVLCLCGMLCLSGCNKNVSKLADGKEIVAELEGKQITAEDLYNALKKEGGSTTLINLIDNYITSKEFTDEDGAKAYAEQQYKYLKSQYEANKTDLDKEILKYYASVQAFKDMIIKDYKSSKVAEKYLKENLTDKEIKEYYEKEIFGKMTVRHILITSDAKSDATDEEKAKAKNEALNKTKELIKKLDNGADFATLAKENSKDGTASNGGLYEKFEKENTDAAFWQASYKLEKDKYTKSPVESQFGYHIIYKISAEDKPSLENSKDKIIEALIDKKINEENAVAKNWVKIREKYKLNILETTINDFYKDTIKKLK